MSGCGADRDQASTDVGLDPAPQIDSGTEPQRPSPPEAPPETPEEPEPPELELPEPEPYRLPEVRGWETAPDLDPAPDVVEIALRAEYADVEIAPGRSIRMMTYNGLFPGPLIQAKVGDRVVVHFENALGEPTTVHWHGLRIPDEMDGSPRVREPVRAGESFTYDFVVPDAGTFWYHPHVRANEQVERGLYGPFIVHDPGDPVVDRERVVVVDDALLDEDGFAPFLAHHMEFIHGRTGNALLINGSAAVPVEAESSARTERWRLINTSNARTFPLSLPEGATIVGTDGGRLAAPYGARRIEIAVGQRYDALVEHRPGVTASLTAHLLTRDASGNVVESPFPLYEVRSSGAPVDPAPPSDWAREARATPEASSEVEIALDGYTDERGRVVWTLNGEADRESPLFEFGAGDVVAVDLVNRQNPEHPFHLHGQFFEILDDGYGRAAPGLRDTVLVPGRRSVRIKAYMDNPGRWMAHCHILEHAELGMMSEIRVGEP